MTLIDSLPSFRRSGSGRSEQKLFSGWFRRNTGTPRGRVSLPFPTMAHFASRRFWTIAPIVCLSSLSISAVLFGVLLYQQFNVTVPKEMDGGRAVHDMGFEHNRLLLAAERGETLQELTLRGEIFLSRVHNIRDTKSFAPMRQLMPPGDLARLYESAEATRKLINHVEQPGGREAFLAQLRTDSEMVREAMIMLSNLDRKLWIERQSAQQRETMRYMLAVFGLLLTLLATRIMINTKMRKAGRALTAELASREAILASVDAAILGLGSSGEVLYSNRNARQLLGARAKRGMRLVDAAAKEEGKLIAELAAMLRARLDDDDAEVHDISKIRVEDESGVRHYIVRMSSAEPFYASRNGGTDAALILVVTDVTLEEEAMLRREEYDVKLGEASRILAYAAMSGGIVHEISQPLAAMRNYVYALKGSVGLQLGNQQLAMLDQLGIEIDRAIEVVRNIRLMGPQGEQENGSCDAHEAIAHSIRLVTLGATPPPPITVTGPEAPIMIAGSLPIIGQVIVNLLKNALNASTGAGRLGASIEVKIEGGSAEIAIADFGKGVSEDAAKSMFAPFNRSTRGGMGLGLAICQRIATSLGGSLSWENSDTAGAVFRFRVPLAAVPVLQ
jgi:C4-dicarboxylate-specific signal transduction histidine kinase